MRVRLAALALALTTALLATACAGNRERSAPHTELVLATWAQITDAHVVDEESPARLEMLDRLGPPFTSAFRPQEALSGQLLTAIVEALNRRHPGAVVETGDLIDNAQANELAEAVAILNGGRVDPNSGASGYQGVQESSNPDPFYYRPAVDPPRHSGLLARAEQPFRSRGLDAPWFPVVGNHDLLVQGNLAPTPLTERVAIGGRKLVSLDRSALELVGHRRLTRAAVDAVLGGGLPGRSRSIAPDKGRRELPAAEVLARLRRASGHGGHGPLLDYSFALGPHVRGVVLDTIRRDSGATRIVRRSQIAWLRRELQGAGSNWIVVFSHTPLSSCQGGATALHLLGEHPRAVVAVAGDTHRNSIERRGRLILVTTSSLADWPQQARMFRLSPTRTGGVVLETWMVGPEPTSLARSSHELAYIDYQGGRPARDAGSPSDRKARILIPPVAP
jgi:3',5'-cyclic AMP phosphodiesterase CpdA